MYIKVISYLFESLVKFLKVTVRAWPASFYIGCDGILGRGIECCKRLKTGLNETYCIACLVVILFENRKGAVINEKK